MKKIIAAGVVAAAAISAFAVPQYGSDYVRSDFIQYNSDNPVTTTTKNRTGRTVTTTDYANHGFSFITVGAGVTGLKISFAAMQDIYNSPIGFYSYTGEFASLAEQQAYINEFRANHPEAELGHGNTTIELSNLDSNAKIGFYMLSDTYGNGRNVTLVSQFNFRDANAAYIGTSSKSVGNIMPADYGDTRIAVYFGDYSTTPWKYNDVVKIETAVVRATVDDGKGGTREIDITLNDDIPGGSSVVDVPQEDGPNGQPLPGVLAVLLLAGGIGGVAARRQKKA